MKTAISIPDRLFEQAEQFARDNGLSRSELFTRAIQLYLQIYRDERITETLNQVYAEESSALDPVLAAAQARTLFKEDR